MTVGLDSYVSVAEADTYVAAHYHGTEVQNRWAGKQPAQKEAMLTAACETLDALPFVGQKASTEQALMFPRSPASAVPRAIKAAQVELALEPLLASAGATETATRLSLQRQGVTGFSIGDLSESYGKGAGLVSAYPALANERVSRLRFSWHRT